MDQNTLIYVEYVHLLNKALFGTKKEILQLAKKNFHRFTNMPDLQKKINDILSSAEKNETLFARGFNTDSLPIDTDTRLELLKRESAVLDFTPVWPSIINETLRTVIEERAHEKELLDQGLHPTKSMLFIGPPGVGKTVAAKWIAQYLNRPLLTLDLAAVMSSFLGKTGNNVRAVLNYAIQTNSILLLDEFDAIAKKRDDATEIGELKRLVTVLLQAIDEWPDNGMLIAATNHPELLDPAVWRRFERVIEFPLPSQEEVLKTVSSLIKLENQKDKAMLDIFAVCLQGSSFAEIVRVVNTIRRESIVKDEVLENLIEREIKLRLSTFSKEIKIDIVKKLTKSGITQRKISELTGMSRDTIRKYIRQV